MRVLVTGGSGFLGSWVTELLSKGGHDVRALVRRSSNRKHLQTLERVELAVGSVEDAASVAEAMRGVDAVVHCAGLVKAKNEAELVRTNVEGTRNLVEAAKAHAPKLRRFVHVSSLEASGPSPDGGPVDPTQEKPCTAYGRSKLAAEKVVIGAKDALPVTVLRPGAIYGPRDAEILEAFKSIKRGLRPTVAGGHARGSYVYGPDCAAACIRAIEADIPTGNVYFVDDGGDGVAQHEFFDMIEQALGRRALIRMNLPMGVLKTVALGVEAYGKASGKAVMLTREKANMLMQHFVCDSSRTQKDLGWKPEVPLREGVRLAVDWYRDHGWL
ncbi:MAG TPA: NAD-dependent epimerase/dehydratase family protein [Polyangiaceae bacterium]|nr:NAD-dependent epimerase/dehydratase family protein [Polyangiaceae bacterium]